MSHELPGQRLATARGLCWTFVAWMVFAYICTPQGARFSSANLQFWLIYAGVFSVVAIAIARIAFGRLSGAPVWRRYVSGGVIGGLTGVLFTIGGAAIGSLLVGGGRPSLRALAGSNMIILISCVGAGIVGGAAAAGARSGLGTRRRLTEAASLFTLLLALAWTLPEAAWPLTRNQHLTVIYAHWYPNDSSYVYNSNPIGFEVEDPQHVLLPRDLDLLKRATVRGRVVVQTSHAVNTIGRPRARMLVLLNGPLARDLRLPQPSRSELLYRQTGDSFSRFPADAAVLTRSVTLSRDSVHSTAIEITIEMARGASSSSGALDFIHRR